jgi:hypothetical protein
MPGESRIAVQVAALRARRHDGVCTPGQGFGKDTSQHLQEARLPINTG